MLYEFLYGFVIYWPPNFLQVACMQVPLCRCELQTNLYLPLSNESLFLPQDAAKLEELKLKEIKNGVFPTNADCLCNVTDINAAQSHG